MKRIDHIIVKVDDLHRAVQEFSEAGFAVFYGSSQEKAYNALIYLQDGSALELLDTKIFPRWVLPLLKSGIVRLLSVGHDRIGCFALKEEPLLDYIIYSSDIDASRARFGRHSGKVVALGKRQKPNGQSLRWWLLFPRDRALPFIISDYVPARMSADETDIQPNGITGLHTLEVHFAGETTAFQQRIRDFYGVEEKNLTPLTEGFQVQTDNARIHYIRSSQHKIATTLLQPRVATIDTFLSKYDLGTA